jgi:hypothetical protein
MIFHQNSRGVIIEMKCHPHPAKKGYCDVEHELLSCVMKEALQQCDSRHYHAHMPKDVTTVCEYGLAFLGPYCGIKVHILQRADGKWVTGSEYTAAEDEK